uniref:Tumor protein D52 n=1 Tax=Suricata suricatta TaxID=37032 RepID=A0A673VI42_SURSU
MTISLFQLPGTKGLSTRGPFPSVGLPLALFFWLSLLSYSVEEEIQTLSQVLAAKEKHLAEIKRKLGINSLQELKQNIAKGWQDVTATSAYVPLIIDFSRECKGHFCSFCLGRGPKRG